MQLVKPKFVVEVGVAYGYHALHILDRNPNVQYVGIDPYLAAYDSEDLFYQDVAELFGDNPSGAMDRLFKAVSETLATRFPDRARVMRMVSTAACGTFDDQSLDFVFIDGDHTENAVFADLDSWWAKVRPGGVLAGDDYTWDGVEIAVHRFFKDRPETVQILQEAGQKHQCFWVRKNTLR